MKKLTNSRLQRLSMAIVIAVSSIALSSCDDEYYGYFDQLPNEANRFINEFYSWDTVIDIDYEGYGTSTIYEVEFASGAVVYFDYYGYWYYVQAGWGDTIPWGIAPYNIERYVNDYYYPAGINTIYIRNWGYKVTLTDGYVINFSPEGYPI